MRSALIFLSLSCLLFSGPLGAQPTDAVAIRQMVEQYQADIRGPYKDIRWFCKDGSILPPKEQCPTGGAQRARYKNEVTALAKSDHIFLGQILSTTDFEAFWDPENYNSRLKQYQLEKYLRNVDDGWVLRKAQYYRGAFQAEDEEAWGIGFLNWLLTGDAPLREQFFLVRQAVRDVPHRGDDNLTQRIRTLSREISDAYSPFLDLRIKIHGQPEAADLQRVRDFRASHRSRMPSALLIKMDQLISDITTVYQPIRLSDLDIYIRLLPRDAVITELLGSYVNSYGAEEPNPARGAATAEMIWQIRDQLLTVKGSKARLALLDLSIQLEEILFRELPAWQPATLRDLLDKTCYLGMAATGGGYLEQWEWQMVKDQLILPADVSQLSLSELFRHLETARGVVEWSAGMTRAVYEDVVGLYGSFEPLAYGFYDDRIRSSVLLNLGETIGRIGDFLADRAALRNQLMDLSNQSQARGLNPGYALGELVVVPGPAAEFDVSPDKIYVFSQAPADLKPVAGIATVSEGNMVSHVQLLARNLGIPNAVISGENLRDLQRHTGRRVFYAVSNQGTVILKLEAQMTAQERELFAVRKRKEERVTVPVAGLRLDQKNILNLRNVDASASGKLCGPKAANLGQLKKLFPEMVVGGLVIPFGIFRDHMDQPMPGLAISYWQYLNDLFAEANEMQRKGQSEVTVETYVLTGLETLRSAIREMKLHPEFIAELDRSFSEILGAPLGEVPVFLRSDTNMEDLKDFTGAGLNLTLFNVVDREKILQGVKDVWASPYTERSYKWRQKYLLNPENVYPSILVIPSVNVDYSGVMITKGITTGDPGDLTVAFSRGVGGAVDGQAAETYLLRQGGENRLLSPAREATYRSLPASGGTQTHFATFQNPVLNAQNLYDLRLLSGEIYQRFPSEMKGPFDVELGFENNKMWLFQIRPFVENRNAATSAYLESITPRIPGDIMIDLSTRLQ